MGYQMLIKNKVNLNELIGIETSINLQVKKNPYISQIFFSLSPSTKIYLTTLFKNSTERTANDFLNLF